MLLRIFPGSEGVPLCLGLRQCIRGLFGLRQPFFAFEQLLVLEIHQDVHELLCLEYCQYHLRIRALDILGLLSPSKSITGLGLLSSSIGSSSRLIGLASSLGSLAGLLLMLCLLLEL